MKRIPNGARVKKINSKPGEDSHQDGALATVIDATGPIPIKPEIPEWMRGMYGYTVVWDDLPGVYVFVAGNRLEEISEPS